MSAVVRAPLDDAAVGEHENQVGVADGRHAVRDDHARPRAPDLAEVAKDVLFRPRVHRRERVVEDEDARIGHERASKRDALLLPTG